MRSVQVFCAAFLIFFCVGLYIGYQGRNGVTDEEYLLASIADNFQTSPFSPYGQGPYNYICNARNLFQYDFVSNSIVPTFADVLSVPQTKIPSSLKGETILLLTSGLTVNELAAAARDSAGLTLRDRIAAVLGGLTGYSVGKWVMARKRPACDSPEIIRRLQRAGYGVDLGRQLVKKALTEALVIVNGQVLTEVSQLSALRSVLAAQRFRDRNPESTANARISRHIDTLLAISGMVQQKDYKPEEIHIAEVEYTTEQISDFLRVNRSAIPGLQGVTTRKALLWRIDRGFSFSRHDIWSSTADFAIFVLWVFGAVVLLVILAIGVAFICVTVRHVLTKRSPDWQTP